MSPSLLTSLSFITITVLNTFTNHILVRTTPFNITSSHLYEAYIYKELNIYQNIFLLIEYQYIPAAFSATLSALLEAAPGVSVSWIDTPA